MYSFQIKPHSVLPGVNIIDILKNGVFVGAIYPKDDHIKIVSAHVQPGVIEEGFAGEVFEDDGSTSFPPIPAVRLTFSPSEWTIIDGKVVRPSRN